MYSADLENSDLQDNSPAHSNNSAHKDRTTLMANWDDLHSKVYGLEEENSLLRVEANVRATDIEKEERKELQLIHECAKQLSKCCASACRSCFF